MKPPGQAPRRRRHPGVLILLVGPSGAGKDTLIDAARRRLAGDPRFRFPKRAITRSDQAGEAHMSLSPERFAELAAGDAFFLSWSAHGTSYGIPSEIVSDLEAGKLVVVNVSRAVIGAARKKWPNLRVVQVWAPPPVLRERLLARGRESGGVIEERLERQASLPANGSADEIENSGDRESAVASFLELLETYAGEAPADGAPRQASRGT